jgi:glycosyltransferase involved in cell wall biosynthesis
MPKISVIIPTYNRADLVSRAIESVIDQTYQDWELLVVDDGSTDNTKEVVEKFVKKDSRIKYFLQSNQGASSARNFGIKNSRGDFVAFLDSDDLYLPDNLEKKIAILSTHQEVVLVNGFSWMVSAVSGKFINYASYSPSNWVVRRNAVGVGKFFDNSESGVEDAGLRMRILNAFNRRDAEFFVKEPLVIYIQHSGQISSVSSDVPIIFAERIRSLLKNIEPNNVFDIEFSSYIYSRLGNFLCLSGDLKGGRFWFYLAMKKKIFSLPLLLFPATFFGKKLYIKYDSLLRFFQRNIFWRLRAYVAMLRFLDSYHVTKKLLLKDFYKR